MAKTKINMTIIPAETRLDNDGEKMGFYPILLNGGKEGLDEDVKRTGKIASCGKRTGND
ncbi:hypothetical protein [Desulfosarcina sp.]|uniref:hypothetical protein n=1 Tax=Desulfosarcina sp. TaxID=2027861 RepID=UPI0039710C9D